MASARLLLGARLALLPDVWVDDPPNRRAPSAERRAEDSRVISERDSAIDARGTDAATHLGARRILIGIRFGAEAHIFVETDPSSPIEGSAGSSWNSICKTLQDEPTIARAQPGRTSGSVARAPPRGTIRRGSDHEAFRELAAEAGYRLPMRLWKSRLAHLREPGGRGELIVFQGGGLVARTESSQRPAFADMPSDRIADVNARTDLIPRDAIGA